MDIQVIDNVPGSRMTPVLIAMAKSACYNPGRFYYGKVGLRATPGSLL
jgi:hypothetical protein